MCVPHTGVFPLVSLQAASGQEGRPADVTVEAAVVAVPPLVGLERPARAHLLTARVALERELILRGQWGGVRAGGQPRQVLIVTILCEIALFYNPEIYESSVTDFISPPVR